jgi:hypothetical protein
MLIFKKSINREFFLHIIYCRTEQIENRFELKKYFHQIEKYPLKLRNLATFQLIIYPEEL